MGRYCNLNTDKNILLIPEAKPHIIFFWDFSNAGHKINIQATNTPSDRGMPLTQQIHDDEPMLA